ncbi:MAG: hypothetical protein HQL58_07820 [Magnetococcales bacterium]|nr:hypothetical protein [Magnetococcales bacterium]
MSATNFNLILGGSSHIEASSFGSMPLAGAGGSITIDTAQLHVQRGGWIGASSEGPGRGGHILIEATDVRMVGYNSHAVPSAIQSDSHSQEANAGTAGDIAMTVTGLTQSI